MNSLFFEVIIAPGYNNQALSSLKSKKNRIILLSKDISLPKYQFKSLLSGALVQERDSSMETEKEMKPMTLKLPTQNELVDLVFANIIVKHSKSNTIVLAKNRQLIASGVGQTSRVDALKHAIEKAKGFGFDLKGAVMASDAFFPFPDCVEIASNAGITAVIQPGGSVKDQDSVNYCNDHGIAMVSTGIRHFKH
jgi:phosphoribosylaminoimidazolecarboxamide formyltransferase/IMP cyclohydrolase